MAPTLNAGDDILVDLGDCAERLRDGIYVLRVDDALVVKRIALHPVGRRVTVQSDNPAYPDWPDCDLDGDPLHRPGDLGRPQDRLSASARAVEQPQQQRRRDPERRCRSGRPSSDCRRRRPSAKPARMPMVRKMPPERALRVAMAAPWQKRPGAAPAPDRRKHGQRAVDDLCRQSRNGRRALMQRAWTHPSSVAARRWPTPPSFSSRFGDDAGFEAAARADTQPRRRQCRALLPLAADRAGDRHAEQRRSPRHRPLRFQRE